MDLHLKSYLNEIQVQCELRWSGLSVNKTFLSVHISRYTESYILAALPVEAPPISERPTCVSLHGITQAKLSRFLGSAYILVLSRVPTACVNVTPFPFLSRLQNVVQLLEPHMWTALAASPPRCFANATVVAVAGYGAGVDASARFAWAAAATSGA